jgi:hypothetical protein
MKMILNKVMPYVFGVLGLLLVFGIGNPRVLAIVGFVLALVWLPFLWGKRRQE